VNVLVDTSAWVEYIHGTGSGHNLWIRAAIADERPLGWTDPVLYELTAGARSPERARELRGLLMRGPMYPVAGLQDWEDAAHLYRAARAQGLTVRSSIDCLITVVALRTDNAILAVDRDFEALAQVSGLELVAP
jgi:predicted nucleic acid-binding protein